MPLVLKFYVMSYLIAKLTIRVFRSTSINKIIKQSTSDYYKSLEKSTKKSTNNIDTLTDTPTTSPKKSTISPQTKTTTKKETKSRKVTQILKRIHK